MLFSSSPGSHFNWPTYSDHLKEVLCHELINAKVIVLQYY